jgi:hypothetical protein
MKKTFILFCLVSFTACVFDSFKPVFDVFNNSKNNLRICFTNNKAIDTVDLYSKYTILPFGEGASTIMYSTLFDKKKYHNTDIKLFMHILNNDSIIKYKKLNEDFQFIVRKSLIEIREVDLLNINEKDTLFIK